MGIILVLKVLGWTMAIVPLVIYGFVSFVVIRGAARDDATIMALVMLGFAIFGLGAGMLLLLYLTDIGARLAGGS